jgi:transcriptional regulator with XRE-family HTH domain
MPTRERLVDLGRRRGVRLMRELGEELRAARLLAGLSQRTVAQAARVSQATVSRAERGTRPYADLIVLATIARTVGLDLTLRCYPAAGPLRDEAHVRLLKRFLSRVARSVVRRLEAPIRLPGDQRAWDVLLVAGGKRIGVAAETRLRDVQALLRHEQAKARDDGLDLLLLIVADTHANRRALRESSALLAAELPLGTREVLWALSRGEAPRASGIVVI